MLDLGYGPQPGLWPTFRKSDPSMPCFYRIATAITPVR